MATEPENYREKLAALRLDYIRSLPDKLGEIELAWNQLLRIQWDGKTLRELHRRTHSLVGSGATFGFPGISDSARSLEQILKHLTAQGSPDDHRFEAEVEDLIMALRKSILQVSLELPPIVINEEAEPKKSQSWIKKSKRVFLVEDDRLQARDLTLQLEHFGYNVRVFHTLSDFRDALPEDKPEAVIMDIVLPDGDGTIVQADLAEEVKSDVPTIFVTSYPDFESRLKAVRAGAKAYLVKPVNIGELVDKLDQMVSVVPPDPFRILIIEDSTVLSQYYALVLQQAGMLTRVTNDPAQVMAALEEFNTDLILMDIYMPNCDGFELAAILRQQDAYMSVPIVFLSSELDLEKQLVAFGIGADDFLTKPITPRHLISAVTSRVQRARELRGFMLQDSLTGLLNHSTVKERLDKELAQAIRHCVPVALAMVDIDHFKAINDQHGHLAGDRVIKGLARLLQLRLRKSDIIGRYGGEEFLIMLYDTKGETARELLDKLRRDFADIQHLAGETTFRVTFSCGIASAAGEIESTTLTNIADRALYQAKHNGRNQVVLVDA